MFAAKFHPRKKFNSLKFSAINVLNGISFSLACRCNEAAAEKNYDYFTIATWGECYGGSDEKTVNDLLANKMQTPDGCKKRGFQNCNDKDKYACGGKFNFEYVYKVKY